MLAPDQLLIELVHPFALYLIGPAKAGKTYLTQQIIERRKEIISGELKHVTYIAAQDQFGFIEFAKSNPEVVFANQWDDTYLQPDSLIVFDDYGQDFSSRMCEFITDLITKKVHHSRVSIICILHNPFNKGLRTANLSVEYLVLFNFPRDRSIISTLARQIMPGDSRFLKDVYEYCITRKPHAYIFLDLSSRQNRRFAVRSNIFNDADMIIFSAH